MPTLLLRAYARRRRALVALSLGLALPILLLGSCTKIEEGAGPKVTGQVEAKPGPGPGGTPKEQYANSPKAEELSAQELFELGKRLAGSGDSERAIRQYRKALELEPGLSEARFALGTALVPSAGAEARGSGTKDPKVMAKAIAHLRQVCQEVPNNADYAYWLGRVLDVAGEEAEAIAALSRATELDPEHGKAFKRLGMAHNEQGNREASLAAWLRAAELLSDDGGVFFNLGNLYFEDDLEKSNAYYRRSTEVEPTSPKGYLGLSKTLAQLGETEQAEEAKKLFERFQILDKQLKRLVFEASEATEDAEKQFAAAEMYFLLDKHDESLAMFSRVLQLNPKSALAHFYIATIFSKRGDLNAALNHFEECVFIEPGIPDSLLALLETCVGLNNKLRAGELCTILEPLVESPDHHARFAELLSALGRVEEAQAHAQKAKREGE